MIMNSTQPIRSAEEQLMIREKLLSYLRNNLQLDLNDSIGILADTLAFLIIVGTEGNKASAVEILDGVTNILKSNFT